MTLYRFKDWKISTKIISISILTILVAVLWVLLYVLPIMREKLIDEKRVATMSIVDFTYSLISDYEARSQRGEFNLKEAQKRALMRIRNLRYKNNDYVWINNMQPRMLMHPIMPELDGKDLSGYKDPNGKKLFDEMVNICYEKGAGFVDYEWQKPGGIKPIRKVSYVKLYKPWGWVIGSGIYIDDVERSVAYVRMEMIIGTTVFAALTLSLAYILGASITRPLQKVINGLQHIVSGRGDIDLTQRLAVTSNEEIGLLSHEFNRLMESISSLATFKKVIEEEDTLSGVYWRLGQFITDKLGLTCIIYEVANDRKGLNQVYPLQASEIEHCCNLDILTDCELCKARKTGHEIASITYPGICKQFLAASGEEHCCVPLIVGGSCVGVVQLIAERSGKAGTDLSEVARIISKAKQYIRESMPVIQTKRLTDDLLESTYTDPLTGLKNRRFLNNCIDNLLAGVLRRGTNIGLIMCDLDYFKQVNDKWGHDVGDSVLRDTANLMRSLVRKADLVIRFGGEEFLVLLIDIEAEQAMLIAEKIRKKVENFSFKGPDGIFNKTISIGVCEVPYDSQSFWQAIKYADVALYKAKDSGRNNSIRFSSEMWSDEQC